MSNHSRLTFFYSLNLISIERTIEICCCSYLNLLYMLLSVTVHLRDMTPYPIVYIILLLMIYACYFIVLSIITLQVPCSLEITMG